MLPLLNMSCIFRPSMCTEYRASQVILILIPYFSCDRTLLLIPAAEIEGNISIISKRDVKRLIYYKALTRRPINVHFVTPKSTECEHRRASFIVFHYKSLPSIRKVCFSDCVGESEFSLQAILQCLTCTQKCHPSAAQIFHTLS